MSQTTEKAAGVRPSRLLRDARDVLLEGWAGIVLGVTSSGAYSRTTSFLARPGLVALAMARGKAEQLMSRVLAELNMPSRADLLSLSTRLTHIETALDDLGAAVEGLRAAAPRSVAPPRRASGDGRNAQPAEEGPRQ